MHDESTTGTSYFKKLMDGWVEMHFNCCHIVRFMECIWCILWMKTFTSKHSLYYCLRCIERVCEMLGCEKTFGWVRFYHFSCEIENSMPKTIIIKIQLSRLFFQLFIFFWVLLRSKKTTFFHTDHIYLLSIAFVKL